MKKLMVALVAVVFGLCAQAASINWSFSWATDASGADLADGTKAYLMAASIMSVADATAALNDNAFDASKAIDVGLTTTAGGNGAEISQVVASDLTGAQTFYAVVIDGDKYAITHTVSTTMKDVGNTNIAFMELSEEDGTSLITWAPGGLADGGGSGTTPAIPEPTSGLLMLVGLGALALRRRRA